MSISLDAAKTKPNEPNLSRRSLWRSRNKPYFTPIASYALWEKVEPTRPYVQVAVLMGRLVWAGFSGKLISVDH